MHQLGFVISISWVTTTFWYQEISFYLEKIKYLRIYSSHGDLITVNPKVAYIPGRDTSIFGKDYTNGSVMYVCLSVVSRKNWQYLQSLVVRIPVSNPSEKAYSLVENAKKMGNRMPFLYTGAQFPYFRRCIKPGLMIPSISITVSGFGQLKMYILHFNVIQLKAVCSALKSLQDKFHTKEF